MHHKKRDESLGCGGGLGPHTQQECKKTFLNLQDQLAQYFSKMTKLFHPCKTVFLIHFPCRMFSLFLFLQSSRAPLHISNGASLTEYLLCDYTELIFIVFVTA